MSRPPHSGGKPGPIERDPTARLSIGALSRITGIAVETLRTWEHRYGFPHPERKPSGHRVYPATVIPRLRRVVEALSRGHRAGDVVPASDAQLAELLQSTTGPVAPPAEAVLVQQALDAVRAFDTERLSAVLGAHARERDLLGFLDQLMVPLVREVGERWETGELNVRHEHFFTSVAGDVLGALRLSAATRSLGPTVLLATPPDELHGLGLSMAALLTASSGCRTVYLGVDVPIVDIARSARELEVDAVALSVSAGAPSATVRVHVRELLARLPASVPLLVGGEGASALRGTTERVVVLTSLVQLDDWIRATWATRLLAAVPNPETSLRA